MVQFTISRALLFADEDRAPNTSMTYWMRASVAAMWLTAMLFHTGCTRGPTDRIPETNRVSAALVATPSKQFSEAQFPVILSDDAAVVHCNIESINGHPVTSSSLSLHRDDSLQLEGWIYLKEEGMPASSRLPVAYALLSELDGSSSYAIEAINLVSRPDVAAHLQLVSADGLGHKFRGTLWAVPPGDYILSIGVLSAGLIRSCPNSRQLLSLE